MEKLVGLKDLRENVEKYVARVQKGESIIVMRRSTPLFRMEPVEDEEWETVVDFTKIRRGGVSVEELLSRL